jgi:membrane protease YdiL (CAAX protease family)
MSMTSLFWNHKEARLRAAWRVLLFFVASAAASEALSGPGGRLLRRLLPVVYANVVEAVLLVLLLGVLLWLAAYLLDRRPIVDYGFRLSRAWWLDLGFGLALGALLLAGVYALQLAMGWVKVKGNLASPPGQPFAAAILADFVVIVCVAVYEETAFRGYPIKNLAEGLNWRVIGPRWATVIAVLIPSVLFGLGHFTNENATKVSTANIMVFALLFGAGYVLTGQLALPIGLHFAWDFVQGFVFGVTGDAPNLGSFLVLAEGDPAARLWMGWPYGVEGGLLGTGAFVLGFLLIATWVRLRRGSVGLYPSLAQKSIRAT